MRTDADQTDGSNADKNNDTLKGIRSESFDEYLQGYLDDAVDVEGS